MKLLTFASLALAASPCALAEARTGVMQHNSAVLGDHANAGKEGGPNIELELSSGRRVSPFAVVSANTDGGTSFAAAGLEYTAGGELFVRPGVGLALHDGNINGPPGTLKLGARALFYARLDVGLTVTDYTALALRIEHLSNGHILGDGPNNGLDTVGISFAVAR